MENLDDARELIEKKTRFEELVDALIQQELLRRETLGSVFEK